MSFRCQSCKKVAQKPVRVVTKTRMHKHIELRPNDRNDMVPTIVGVGPQIAAEATVCTDCA